MRAKKRIENQTTSTRDLKTRRMKKNLKTLWLGMQFIPEETLGH